MSDSVGRLPEIRLLGSVSVRLGEGSMNLGGARVRTLLVTLALSAGQPLPTALLAERIWGDDPLTNIGPSLHTLMTRLRRGIGSDLVTTGPTGYTLLVDPDQVDALKFARLVREAGHESDPDQEHALLVEALALWTGRPFEGIRSEWLETTEGPRLVEQYLAALERRVDLRVDDREYTEVVAELRKLTEAHPLRESLWVRLLRLLAQTGRVAEALTLYESVRRRIADELGTDPGADLQALQAQLLAGESGATKPLLPRQLPADLASFSGRRPALEQLDAVLEAGEAATIVAIDGIGGAGKTALAVHWAHGVSDRFPDGQLYVNLRGYSAGGVVQPERALESLLTSMGVETAQIPAALEARSAMFRTLLAGKEILLVLDNALNAAQVRPLLPGAGGFVVVTSRNQLRGLVAREGARRLSIGPMSAAESTELLSRVVAESPHDVDELTRFAELCGRLPLALVIAAERAGRSPGTDISSITRQLEETGDRLDALEIGDDELSSMRAVLSWSYQALSPEAARLFRLLGAYPAAVFAPPAIAALAGVTELQAERLLDHLVEANLAEHEEGGDYQLHDLLSLYAKELEEPDETRQAAARLLDWLAHTAEGARLVRGGRLLFQLLEPSMDGVRPMSFDGDPAAALAWFDREWSTLLAAVALGAEHGHDRLAACLASALWDYLDQRRSPTPETIAAHETTVQCAERTGEAVLEGVARNQLAVVYGLVGRYPDSRDQFLLALDLFAAVDAALGVAMVHDNLGITYARLGDFEASIAQLEASLAIGRDRRSVGATHNNLASTFAKIGRYDDAIASAQAAIELHRSIGFLRGVAYALDTLGDAHFRKGEFAQAINRLEESADLARELQIGAVEVPTLVRLGEAYEAIGQLQAARDAYQRALAAAEHLGPSLHFSSEVVLKHLEAFS